MNPKMTFSPAHQVQPTYSPDPRINRPPGPYYNSGPMPPPMTPSPAHHFRPMYSLDPRMYQRPQNSYYGGSPAHHVRPPYSPDPRMHQQQPRGSYYNSGPINPSNMPPYSTLPPQGQSRNFQGQSPCQKAYGNTHSSSFNGKSRQGFSGFGKGGKQGGSGGSQEIESAEIRPDKYYNKSMVEDPWKNLKPSIWKTEVSFAKKFNCSSGATSSSHSDSFRTKKPRVSGSQPSLAEILAAAFNETIGEKGDSESTPDSTTFSHSDSFGTKNPTVSEAPGESSSQPRPEENLAASFNETVDEKGDNQGSSL